jgi:predicted RNase H-like nuclease (RuvC/YqgF family)
MSADDKADAAWDDYVSQQQQEKIEELERQLNEANQRIKRLEQAGDAMAVVLVWSSGTQYKRSPTALAWRKAKEAKP